MILQMNFNLLLLVAVLVLTVNVANGYKRGMVREIISFISLIITCVVVALLANALNSYFDGQIINVVVAVLLLCVVGIVHHLLRILFFSAKLISKLPIVSWADKLLGIAVGALETVLLLWTMYTFVMMMDMGMIGQQILEYTEDNTILKWLFERNYVALLVEQITGSELSGFFLH